MQCVGNKHAQCGCASLAAPSGFCGAAVQSCLRIVVPPALLGPVSVTLPCPPAPRMPNTSSPIANHPLCGCFRPPHSRVQVGCGHKENRVCGHVGRPVPRWYLVLHGFAGEWGLSRRLLCWVRLPRRLDQCNCSPVPRRHLQWYRAGILHPMCCWAVWRHNWSNELHMHRFLLSHYRHRVWFWGNERHRQSGHVLHGFKVGACVAASWSCLLFVAYVLVHVRLCLSCRACALCFLRL